jgi:hypothetical protein
MKTVATSYSGARGSANDWCAALQAGRSWVRFPISCTRHKNIWGSGGIAPFIANSGARRLTRTEGVACSHQQSYEWRNNKHANTQCIRAFNCCQHMALTAAVLPTHETEYTVVEPEWGERNHLLIWTVQKGTKHSPENLHRNWHCSVSGEESRAASSGANIRARGRAQTVEFLAFIYTATGKILLFQSRA